MARERKLEREFGRRASSHRDRSFAFDGMSTTDRFDRMIRKPFEGASKPQPKAPKGKKS